jgi:hypothetical protein
MQDNKLFELGGVLRAKLVSAIILVYAGMHSPSGRESFNIHSRRLVVPILGVFLRDWLTLTVSPSLCNREMTHLHPRQNRRALTEARMQSEGPRNEYGRGNGRYKPVGWPSRSGDATSVRV